MQERDAQCIFDTNEQPEGKQTNNGAKKKQNNGLNRMQSSWKKSQNANARNEHQKRARENKNNMKRIVLEQMITIWSPNFKKKQIERAERQLKRGGGTEKNLQKTNNAKVNSFAAKMNEAMRKSIAKNKTSKELHMLNQKAKKQARK